MAGPDTSAFTAVKEQVDLEDYLTNHLGVDLVPSGGGRMAALCPFHAEDTPSFMVEDTGDGWKRWHCYGACQEGGTVIDAAMKAEGYELAREAIVYLNDLYGLDLDINMASFREFAQQVAETENEIKRTREEINSGSDKAKIAEKYLMNRGLSKEAIDFFQLGLDTEQTKSGRISIPLIDKANHPVSIANRALFDKYNCAACGEEVTVKEIVKQRHQAKRDQEKGEGDGEWKYCPHCKKPDREAKIAWLFWQNPKYRFIGGFDKAEFLYNENSARKILNKQEEVIGLFLAEGYGEVWAGWMSDNKAFCAYSGAVLSDWQAREAVELVKHSGKPVILVPDFDATGIHNVDKNIRKLRAVSETLEIQVVHGIDKLKYTDHTGEEVPCKDLGDVLQHFGPEKVAEVLENNRWAGAEWQIRQILGKRNQKTGKPFHSVEKQMQLVAEVLSHEHSRKVSLDHLVEYLANVWDSPQEAIRTWFYSNLSEDNATSYQHLFKDIEQSRWEAQEFLRDTNVIPLGFEDLDKNLPGGGARPGQLCMALGKSGTGKSLRMDAKLLTPTGWIEMRDVKVGDVLVDPVTGGRTKVIGVFPQGKRQMYKVTFSDGTSIECDGEHQWKVLDSSKVWKVKTINEIRERIDLSKSPHFIPVTAPIEFEEHEELPIDPYLLGVLLGDGSICNHSPRLTTADPEIVEYVKSALPSGVTMRQLNARSTGTQYDWVLIRTDDVADGRNVLKDALRALDLWGARAWEKKIPAIYRFASIENRLALLRGLMDTDGCVTKQTRREGSVYVEFCSSSEQMAKEVCDLVRSLGGLARVKGSESAYRKPDGERVNDRTRYRVRVTMPPHLNPFRLPRKAGAWTRLWQPSRRMLSIEEAGVHEAQCIAVDSPEQLYITDDYLVTHNTMLASQMLANMADHNIRSIFFSLEQAAKSLFGRLVSQALDVDGKEAERLIKNEEDDPEIEKQLEPVRELYKNMLIVDNVPTENQAALDMTPSRVQAIIQEANLTHFDGKPAQVVIIDHLGILNVDEDAPRDVKASDLMAPGYIMQKLFEVCKATNVFMLVLQQLPKEVPPGKPFSYDAGRGGSKQTDFCDYILQIYRPEQSEELSDEDRAQVEGQYKIVLGKNRYGGSTVFHGIFDKSSLRIMPALKVHQPDEINEEAVIELEDDEEGVPPELRVGDGEPEEAAPSADGEAGKSPEQIEALAKQTDDSPEDALELLKAIGAKPESEGQGDEGDEIDPTLGAMFDD